MLPDLGLLGQLLSITDPFGLVYLLEVFLYRKTTAPCLCVSCRSQPEVFLFNDTEDHVDRDEEIVHETREKEEVGQSYGKVTKLIDLKSY